MKVAPASVLGLLFLTVSRVLAVPRFSRRNHDQFALRRGVIWFPTGCCLRATSPRADTAVSRASALWERLEPRSLPAWFWSTTSGPGRSAGAHFFFWLDRRGSQGLSLEFHLVRANQTSKSGVKMVLAPALHFDAVEPEEMGVGTQPRYGLLARHAVAFSPLRMAGRPHPGT